MCLNWGQPKLRSLFLWVSFYVEYKGGVTAPDYYALKYRVKEVHEMIIRLKYNDKPDEDCLFVRQRPVDPDNPE